MQQQHSWLRRMLLLTMLGVATLAQAQNYPSKPLRWIVGYPAGGGSDFLARAMGEQMSGQMGQSIIIDNRPGSGAIIGADVAAKAPGDGYTVFTADNGVLVYNPVLYKKLPYDPIKDFAPIGLMARTPLMIVASPNSGFKDPRAMLADIKAHPGKYSYGSPGNGSPHHLAMELLKTRLNLFIVHVPYRGAAPAMQDLMGGQIPLMMVDASSALSAIKSGRVVPIVSLSAQRMAQFPQVPTMAELGYPDVHAYAWQGLVAPVSTPKDIQMHLNVEMQKALHAPALRKKLEDYAWEPIPSDGKTMADYTATESRIWQKLIRDRGIKLD